MPIVGHGIDLVEIARIARMIQEHGERFLDRCFTASEQRVADESGRREEFLAGRFASKEAVLKALGTGWSQGIAWTDLEVLPDNAGKPLLSLHGQARSIAQRAGISAWHVSISHAGGLAQASVIAEGDGSPEGRMFAPTGA